VVTGLGRVTPLGVDWQACWDALPAGKSRLGPVRCQPFDKNRQRMVPGDGASAQARYRAVRRRIAHTQGGTGDEWDDRYPCR